jgi:hypothetical protein
MGACGRSCSSRPTERWAGSPRSSCVDLPFDPYGPLPPLGGVFTEAKGTHVAFASGSVWFVRPGVGEATWRAAITRNDGKVGDPDW